MLECDAMLIRLKSNIFPQRCRSRHLILAPFTALLVSLLHGCVSSDYGRSPDAQQPTIEELDVGETSIDDYDRGGGNTALERLLAQANDAAKQQQYERAASLAERAMRIAPNDPQVYFLLGQLSYFQQDLTRSKSLMAKARSLAQGDKAMSLSIDEFVARYLR